MNKKLTLLVALVLINGCASTYQHKSLKTPTAKLNPALGVLVSVPKDGKYVDKLYTGSGQKTAGVVKTVFENYAKTVKVTNQCHGDNCLKNIDTATYGYYVQPDILHWEDRATEWSGIPDRVQIQLTVFDAKTKQEVAKISYSGKSKWMTFGGDHPEDLLPEPTEQVIESFYK